MTLFFTRGVSLQQWVNAGLFEREKKLYEAHLESGNLDLIYWVTYGSQDEALSELLKGEGRLHSSVIVCQMPVVFNVPIIGSWVYSLLLPLILYKTLSNSDILKTNQMDGSWSAVAAKYLFNKKLVVRTGYTLSQLENQLKRYSRVKLKFLECIEMLAYKYADIGIVASEHNKRYLIEKYQLNPDAIEVLGNYIDEEVFRYDASINKKNDSVVFVGRLSPEKNLYNLIDAISLTSLTLDIVGQGELLVDLKSYVESKKAKVNFLGVVPNVELPNLLNRYTYYILPSLHEGMPKTLLEAMACGLICIGTNVSGINEVISHEVNGYLVDGTDSASIASAITNVVEKNIGSFKKVRDEAMKSIRERYSLSVYVHTERLILDSIS